MHALQAQAARRGLLPGSGGGLAGYRLGQTNSTSPWATVGNSMVSGAMRSGGLDMGGIGNSISNGFQGAIGTAGAMMDGSFAPRFFSSNG